MAAYDGFQAVWCNGMRYLIVAGVGEIMMFVGKIMIAAGSTAIFYVIITFIPSIKENIIEPIYALLVRYGLILDCVHHFILRGRAVHGYLLYCHGYHLGMLYR